ncbi:hypothetical protein B9S64_30275 [Streptomyces sp. SM18]|nr:hypothetical protein B9S64_30275 [Streptomyces sp. SM18]
MRVTQRLAARAGLARVLDDHAGDADVPGPQGLDRGAPVTPSGSIGEQVSRGPAKHDPGVHMSDAKARAFAVASIAVRSVASRVWSGRGQVVADLPIIELGAGPTPWVVSSWAHGEARLWWWAAGLAAGVAADNRVVARTQEG